MAYIDIPKEISSKEILDNECNLSSNAYKRLLMKNTNFKTLRKLLKDSQSGKEVGSIAYVKDSEFIFLRTKAINSHLFCLDFVTQGAIQCIKPNSYRAYFKNFMNLYKNDILFVTGGNVGEVVFVDKDYTNVIFSSHIVKIQVIKNPYYIFAMLKHNICREQVNFSPIGAIKGLDTFKIDYLYNCKIPFPNINAKQTIEFIEILTQSIITKERLIKERHAKILQMIKTELLENQKPNTFTYAYPTFTELKKTGRLDTGIYCEEFKRLDFLIKNYKYGSKLFDELEMSMSRGQNLQESCIGKSIYSQIYKDKFYSLALPTYFSYYGTINKTIYLGNRNNLKTLKKGEIVFGAEGTFRSIVILDDVENFITNIHGITLYKNNVLESIFIKLFMDFLASKKFIDFIKVGGHGGSLAQKYWNLIPFPNFPLNLQEQIALLYHNPNAKLNYEELTLKNFTIQDEAFCKDAGIYELDKSIKYLKNILNSCINDIINDKEVLMSFTKN